MLTFSDIIIFSTLRKQVILLNYLCSIIFKLVPRKRRKRKTGSLAGKEVLRLVYVIISLLIQLICIILCSLKYIQAKKNNFNDFDSVLKMPHNPHFRRDVETSIQGNQTSSTPNNDLTDLPAEKISKSSDFVQKARLVLPFVYGGVASCVAEAATFPIDTAKTRLQLQGQSRDVRHSSTPYRGM